MVSLREITEENFPEVVELRASEPQKDYVSSVAYSLAQAWAYKKTAFPFAIYADETPVGFVMLGYYAAREQYTLWKFLVDERYQHRGYGREALKLAIEFLAETFKADEIYTGVVPENTAAKQLYRSVGFRETGLAGDGMEEMRLVLNTEE